MGIWGRLTRVVLGLLVVAGLLGVMVWYYPLFKQNQRMRQQLMVREGQIAQEEETNRWLKASIEAMRDPKTVERLARENLSYARTGETVFRFEPPPTNGVGGARGLETGPAQP